MGANSPALHATALAVEEEVRVQSTFAHRSPSFPSRIAKGELSPNQHLLALAGYKVVPEAAQRLPSLTCPSSLTPRSE